MLGMTNTNPPTILADGVTRPELTNVKSGTLARHLSAAVAKRLKTHRVIDPSSEIWPIGTVLREQPLGHPAEWCWTQDLQIVTRAGTLIPTGEDEVRVVTTVVEVQMGEEHVVDGGGIDAEKGHIACGTWSKVEDHTRSSNTDVDGGSAAMRPRVWGSRAQEHNAHWLADLLVSL
jgi:hypothetical protein